MENPVCETIEYENRFITDLEEDYDSKMKCEKCSLGLEEPYICCDECNQLFCLECFASGAETSIHKNNHSYVIRNDKLVVFSHTNWTAAEEKKLLDALSNCGNYGNWAGISRLMETRSPEDCKNHYLNYYFDGIFEKALGLTNKNMYVPGIIPYLYKHNTLEPPRYDVDDLNFKNTAGYRFARSEFELPYDNSAEAIVSYLKPETGTCQETNRAVDELNCAMFRAFNHRLK